MTSFWLKKKAKVNGLQPGFLSDFAGSIELQGQPLGFDFFYFFLTRLGFGPRLARFGSVCWAGSSFKTIFWLRLEYWEFRECDISCFLYIFLFLVLKSGKIIIILSITNYIFRGGKRTIYYQTYPGSLAARILGSRWAQSWFKMGPLRRNSLCSDI